MGNKSFRCLHDFARHGQNIQLTCGNGACGHGGVVNAWDAVRWFKAHLWYEGLKGLLDGKTALLHFRCKLCGHRAGRATPTDSNVTVTNFFPVNEQGWRMLIRRLRD